MHPDSNILFQFFQSSADHGITDQKGDGHHSSHVIQLLGLAYLSLS
jgi:hypothetical protein